MILYSHLCTKPSAQPSCYRPGHREEMVRRRLSSPGVPATILINGIATNCCFAAAFLASLPAPTIAKSWICARSRFCVPGMTSIDVCVEPDIN